MSYARLIEDAPPAATLGCGGSCSCSTCRRSPQSRFAGLGCGRDCQCEECRARYSGLAERYVPDDDADDAPPQPPTAGPQAAPAPAPSGVSGSPFDGLAEAPGPRVVFVPGIMGSRLIERWTRLPVWGDVRMLAAVMSLPTLIAWRQALSSGNGINDGGMLAPAGLIRLPRIDPYSAMVSDLNAAFGPPNVLVFAYDWRLANEHNAGRLHAAIRARWPDAENGGERRVTIVAHSMGGLLARWLVERLGGSRLVRRLITVGTPHFGAPEALTLLSATTFGFVPGQRWLNLVPGIAIVMREIARLARQFGSVAQLLPGFDFFLSRGASRPEPIAATFARIRSSVAWTPLFGGSILRSPAGHAIRNLNRTLIGGVSSLDSLLAREHVEYFTFGTSDHETTVQAREVIGPAIAPIRIRCGDGTVPASSALLPGASRIKPIHGSSPMEHSELFNDPAVRRLCIAIASGGSPPVGTAPPCAGTAPRTGLEGRFSETMVRQTNPAACGAPAGAF